MSTISLRLPDSLHKSARQLAEKESVSLNQLITLALAEKIACLTTEDFFTARGKRASRRKFQQALRKIPARKARPSDRV
jgi:predicted transcriptional regulator